MKVSKSLLSLALAVACAAITISLAMCAQAQTFSEQRPSNLKQLAELTESDNDGYPDGFGYAIAMSGDTIVVAAPSAHDTGAAYVFVKPASGWANMTQTAELTPSDGFTFLDFGISVGISGNTIVVGSLGNNAAYVFTKRQGGWQNMTETAVLSNTNGVATMFGANVAIDGATIAVSEPKTFTYRGRVQIFTEPAGGWVNATPTGSIIASDTASYDYFGSALAVSGSTIVAGAYNNNNLGAAYVFVEPAAGWSGSHSQKAKLTASDGRQQDALGATVAINGNTIVAGAQKRNNDTGLAYVFVEPASGWKNMTQTGELSATGLAVGDFFGIGVAVSPTKIAIGSATTSTTGTAYAYSEPSSGWKNMLPTSEATVTGGGIWLRGCD
jgi:FG-GAP repeat